MRKNRTKQKNRDSEKATRVKKVAELTGVSPRQVYRVIRGDESNDAVLRVYMQLTEGENLLLQAVKETVSFE
jgi:predicted regulator of amino acid metabolism with ACT domain